ncbi:MAG: hypothetical protein WDM89_22425 [Rhizomicrobium sp.]
MTQNDRRVADRRSTAEAGVVAALVASFATSEKHHVLVGTITNRFNDDHEAEYGHP